MRRVCLITASIHLLAMAVSTYVAAYEIRTILVSGVICSLTGMVAGGMALATRRYLLALGSSIAPGLAGTLFVLESFYWNWGPQRAADPFMMIFLAHQVVTMPLILVQLRLLYRHPESSQTQLTLRMVMLTVALFATIFSLSRVLLEMQEHSWLMAIALGFLGATLVGLAAVVYSAWRTSVECSTMELRNTRRIAS